MKIFTKEFLLNDLDLPGNAIEDTVDSIGRWSAHRKIIFDYEGNFYETFYSCGLTEQQDENPWEYEETVECYEVEQKEVLVKKWVII